MKQNQKGFTLIELLAVIVILAIVALISTPIILNVINDSRKKAAIDSSYGVIKAIQLAYTQNQVQSNAVNANQKITFTTAVDTLKIGTQKISISGDIPISGTADLDISTGVVKLTRARFGSYYCSSYGTANNKVCCVTSDTTCTKE